MRCALLVLAVLALAGLSGCRAFDKFTKEKDKPAAEPASRTKNPDWVRGRQDKGPPENFFDRPETPGRGARVPAGDTASDNRNPASKILSGFLEDADGRPIGGGYIKVENADPVKAGYGAPMGVESLRDGTFEIQGLNPGEYYALSCQIARDGRTQAGRVIVQVPKGQIRLRLREDALLPPMREGSDLPPGPAVPPKVFDTPKGEGDWSPIAPKPAESSNPRNELVAPGPAPWKPPVANIPGPNTAPAIPPLGPTSKSISRSTGISLVDADGRRVNVLSGRPEDLVLLDFCATYCKPCKASIPAIVAFHQRYGKQVEVIGVLCDDGAAELAANYKRDHRLPYTMMADEREAAQNALGVDRYPTIVLLDGTGRKLWKGHPNKLAEVETILRNR